MQRDAIEEASYLVNLAIKEFEVLLCCCLSILNLFPLCYSYSDIFENKLPLVEIEETNFDIPNQKTFLG